LKAKTKDPVIEASVPSQSPSHREMMFRWMSEVPE
jgi:hypothetical protein